MGETQRTMGKPVTDMGDLFADDITERTNETLTKALRGEEQLR